MSEPLQLAFELSFFFRLLHGLSSLSMGPIIIAALGAGAFVTTVAVGAILLHTKVLSKSVEVDAEKGLEQNALERREVGPGWKEFTEEDEKSATSTSELLLPLFQNQESDIADTLAKAPRAPLTPAHLPPLQESCSLSNPSAQQRAGQVIIPEDDISETCDWHEGPAFPPGLPLPANVAVVAPISAPSNRISDLSPLDTEVSGVASWPVLAPTPIEETRGRTNGPGAKVNSIQTKKPDIKDDVVPQDELSSSSSQPGEPGIVFNDMMIPASVSIHGSDEEDPFADPTDPAYSPPSELLPMIEDISPACTPRSAAISLDKVDHISRSSDADWPSAHDPVPSSSILCVVPSITVPDTVFAANIPLPESPPLSPKVVSSLLVHPLTLDTIATTTVTFGGELSPWVDVSDQESTSPSTASFAPVLSSIITTLRTEEDLNEAPCSPLSDAGSLSSSSESSGPVTPTELKHDLPFTAAINISSKGTPELQIPFDTPMEGDVAIDEDVEIVDDFVIVGQHAPDPPSPVVDVISPGWITSKLPGSFDEATASASDRSHPDQQLSDTMAVADVPPLTPDMIQLCHAVLAVSNCAGLVAQFAIGFSAWWSLTLVAT
ncbi:unnamed protein product [Rhizoctonia solani]|uniref:Transmembrane protein n=1 Tax=Rhizoctonia solani TaxID=456999 RepID=A0A8H3BQ27_9AGAM|nr:unnamed protein product [Rhizoctonia solani]